MTLDQLRQLAANAGFPDPNVAAAIAMAESGGNPNATNIVTNPLPGNGPERSFGLWQINTLAHPNYNESQLLDPAYNASAAFSVSSGGTNFHPWSTYNHGDYLKYMPAGTITAPSTLGRDLAIAAVIVGAGALAAYALRKPVAGRRYAMEANSNVQTLIFSRSAWTVSSAKAWARRHGYRTGVDLKPNTIRMRQADPGEFRRMRTIAFGQDIKAVVGFS